MKQRWNHSDMKKIFKKDLIIPQQTEQALEEAYQFIRLNSDTPSHSYLPALRVAAVLAVLFISFAAFCNTSFAKELYSRTFGLLFETTKNSKTQADDETFYKQAEKYAVPLENTSSTVGANTFSITDAYYDGEIIYIFFTMQTTDPLLQSADYIEEDHFVEASTLYQSDDAELLPNTSLYFSKSSNGTFAGYCTLSVFNPQANDITINLSTSNLAGYSLTEHETFELENDGISIPYETNKKVASMEGMFSLHFTVPLDTTRNETLSYSETKNSITLEKMVRTPVSIFVQLNKDIPAEYIPQLYDESGVKITCHGAQDNQWVFNYSESTHFVLKIIDKNTDQEIALFDIPSNQN